MSNYRITIEVLRSESDGGFERWDEQYRQTVPEINIGEVANLVNKVYAFGMPESDEPTEEDLNLN